MAKPDVSKDTLLALIARETESWDLDYKEQFRPSSRAELLEITKDLGVMMARGGHIVIGADSYGRLSGGLSENDRVMLDEATLRAKVQRYFPAGFEFYTAAHRHEGRLLGIIHVLPHPDGFCCFSEEGHYKDEYGRHRTAFRQAVYVRRGTSSVQATHAELRELITLKEAGGPIDRRPGWQYLAFVHRLEEGLADNELAWRDYRLRVTRTVGTERIGVAELGDDVGRRIHQAKQLIANLDRILTAEHSDEAFRTAVEHDDPASVHYLADGILGMYQNMLSWAGEIRGLRLDDEVRLAYELLAEFVDLPINQVRQWIAQLGLQIREAVEWLRSTSEDDGDGEVKVVDTELVVSVDPTLSARLEQALDDLQRR